MGVLAVFAVFLAGHIAAAEPAPIKPLPAEAEVTDSSGSVQLTFRVFRTNIPIKEGFWCQIELKNIGTEPLVVMDSSFFDPAFLDHDYSHTTHVEARSPDGKRLRRPWSPHGLRPEDLDDPEMVEAHFPSTPYVKETPDVIALRESLRRQGLSESEIKDRLVELQSRKNSKAARDSRPSRFLQPGESIVTPPYVNRRYSEAAKKYEKTQVGIGQFAEVDFFSWPKPGIYKVRAVYDHNYASCKRRECVTVRTPWMRLRVR